MHPKVCTDRDTFMLQYRKQHTESPQHPHRKEMGGRLWCTAVISEHLWMGDSFLIFKIAFLHKKTKHSLKKQRKHEICFLRYGRDVGIIR